MSLQLKETKFFVRQLVVLMLLILPLLTWADASSPMEVVQSGTDKVLAIIHQSKTGDAPPLRQKEGEILEIVSSYFNFDEMAKRSLGYPWNQQSPEKRQEFAELFKKLLFNTYLGRMEHYHDEKTFYDSQKVDNDLAVVETHFLHQGENIQIDYMLHKDEGHWKVYDVVLEGISYVHNYRSQFDSILGNQSFDSLLRMLREKVERTS